ncbi:MAG: hypothetical protein JKY09_05595 [Crocinitomicaceae bacterium]|nr:hypothetical protein [Crocinitomicaceae bacterium]
MIFENSFEFGFDNLPDSLEQALKVGGDFFPKAAIRARFSLEILLRKSLKSRADKTAWGFSHLAKGYPVEFTFKPDQKGIQYTTDIAGPEMSPNKVLPYALELLSELGASRLNEENRLFFEIVQQQGELLYGCWIGGRHSSEGDEYKLYIEIPEASGEMAMKWLRKYTPFDIDFHNNSINDHCGIKLEMIGYSLRTKSIECYFSVKDLAPWEIDKILKPIHLEGQREYLIDLLQSGYSGVIYRKFPSKEMGFSYSFSPSKNNSVFSLYTFASSMFGGDMRVRDSILALCLKKNWNMDFYEKFTQTFADNKSDTHTHGLFGIALDQFDNTTIYTGLRPTETAICKK